MSKFELTDEQKKYLRNGYLGDIAINFGINFFIGLFAGNVITLWGNATPILFFGASNLLLDIFWMSFYIGLLANFFVTWFTYNDIQVGKKVEQPEWKKESLPILKYIPNNWFLRALVFCVATVIMYVPLTYLLLFLAQVSAVPYWHFAVLKGIYGMVIAPPVCHLSRLSALTDETTENVLTKLWFKVFPIKEKSE